MRRIHKHPLFVLEEMDQHFRQQQSPAPDKRRETFGLGVMINGRHFLLKTPQLSEVIRLDKQRKLSPIPTERLWHKGLMSVRGQLVNIIDLSAYLMEKTTEISTKTRIIIVGRDHYLSGFLVDECTGVIQAKKDESIKTIDQKLPGRLAFVCRRTILLGGIEWTELDLERLYADPEFVQVTSA